MLPVTGLIPLFLSGIKAHSIGGLPYGGLVVLAMAYSVRIDELLGLLSTAASFAAVQSVYFAAVLTTILDAATRRKVLFLTAALAPFLLYELLYCRTVKTLTASLTARVEKVKNVARTVHVESIKALRYASVGATIGCFVNQEPFLSAWLVLFPSIVINGLVDDAYTPHSLIGWIALATFKVVQFLLFLVKVNPRLTLDVVMFVAPSVLEAARLIPTAMVGAAIAPVQFDYSWVESYKVIYALLVVNRCVAILTKSSLFEHLACGLQIADVVLPRCRKFLE